MSAPGLAKTSACDCYGCQMRGQGACSAFTCSECAFESLEPLVVEDSRDGEHGPVPYRPCAECRTTSAA